MTIRNSTILEEKMVQKGQKAKNDGSGGNQDNFPLVAVESGGRLGIKIRLNLECEAVVVSQPGPVGQRGRARNFPTRVL